MKRIARGKVRDVYEVDGDRLLLVATDRVSAFDVVMAEPIPMKGAVLTQMSAWWFRQLGDDVRHHMISADADEIIAAVPALEAASRRSSPAAPCCAGAARCFPIECVIRGYLSGSAWREYAEDGTLAGETLPPGLQGKRPARSADLQPRDQGRERPRREHHGRPHARGAGRRGDGRARAADAPRLHARAATSRSTQGIIIADTKFEFGRAPRRARSC